MWLKVRKIKYLEDLSLMVINGHSLTSDSPVVSSLSLKVTSSDFNPRLSLTGYHANLDH